MSSSLCCPSCNNTYTSKLHQPVCLTCGDVYCRLCVVDIYNRNKETHINCPRKCTQFDYRDPNTIGTIQAMIPDCTEELEQLKEAVTEKMKEVNEYFQFLDNFTSHLKKQCLEEEQNIEILKESLIKLKVENDFHKILTDKYAEKRNKCRKYLSVSVDAYRDLDDIGQFDDKVDELLTHKETLGQISRLQVDIKDTFVNISSNKNEKTLEMRERCKTFKVPDAPYDVTVIDEMCDLKYYIAKDEILASVRKSNEKLLKIPAIVVAAKKHFLWLFDKFGIIQGRIMLSFNSQIDFVTYLKGFDLLVLSNVVSNSNAIQLIDFCGNIKKIVNLEKPQKHTLLPFRRLAVGCHGNPASITIFTLPELTLTHTIFHPTLSIPNSIDFYDGKLYVCNTSPSVQNIAIFELITMNFVGNMSLKFGSPQCVHFVNGQLFVTGGNKVTQLNPSKNFETICIVPSDSHPIYPTQITNIEFNNPTGLSHIVVHNNDIFLIVCDYGNCLLKLFRLH